MINAKPVLEAPSGLTAIGGKLETSIDFTLEESEKEAIMAISQVDESMLRGRPVHLEGRGGGAFRVGRGGRGMGMGMGGERMCVRCGQIGHIVKYCPTQGDASFDPSEFQKISNVPKSIRQTVTSIEGMDTSKMATIKNEDGTFTIVSASEKNLERLTRDGLVKIPLNDAASAAAAAACVSAFTLRTR